MDQLSISSINSYDWVPYTLPSSPVERSRFLAKVLNLPGWCSIHGNEYEVKALLATLLYPRMERSGKSDVLKLISGLSNQRLADCLRGEIATTTLVQKQWGLWSLNSKELEAMLAKHKYVSNFLQVAGAKSVLDLFKGFNSVKSTKLSVIVLSIIYSANRHIESDVNNEIRLRTKVRDYGAE
jgi:hypothetical protein